MGVVRIYTGEGLGEFITFKFKNITDMDKFLELFFKSRIDDSKVIIQVENN